MHLTEKQLKLITEIASKEALKAFKSDLEKQESAKHDRRLHNIKLLLKHYRSLVLHCKDIEVDMETFQNMSIQDLDIDEINLEAIQSIKQSKKKSLAMMYFIKGKIESYKQACSSKELRYYRVLEKKYISDKKYTIDEIAAIEHIDRATVHRHLQKALEELPVIFFGIDAVPLKKDLQ